VKWLLTVRGATMTDDHDERGFYGHDTSLEGWPWVEGTHSWVEPTAINVLALRSHRQAEHPRCREAVKLLFDRQLPGGGWNYGNTTILGNTLRQHVEPTGLTLAALAGEKDVHARGQKSFDWLGRTISEQTPAASLCYAVLGLSTCGRRPKAASDWLAATHRRASVSALPYRQALLVLAAEVPSRPDFWTIH
jgi:hypothetical protein